MNRQHFKRMKKRCHSLHHLRAINASNNNDGSRANGGEEKNNIVVQTTRETVAERADKEEIETGFSRRTVVSRDTIF